MLTLYNVYICDEIPLWVNLSLGQHAMTVTARLLGEWD